MHILFCVVIKWDPDRAAANRTKHGIRLSDAATVLDDPFVLTREDPDVHGESCYLSLGRYAFGRILVVVWTEREDGIRLISARKASPAEARHHPG
jgi:uncharacterized DUF497 family protein